MISTKVRSYPPRYNVARNLADVLCMVQHLPHIIHNVLSIKLVKAFDTMQSKIVKSQG